MSLTWAKGAVYYQIFPDRFNNGDPENDVKNGEYEYVPGGSVVHADWESPIEPTDVHRFYGGDLEGVWDKFDYLSDLGVEVLLFNPVFKSPSNHKYDVADYNEIDPHLAGKHARNQENPGQELTPNEYFAYFVKAAHEAGFKVILDGVFNHCSNENAWFGNSEKKNFFARKENGEISYWWNVLTLPKLRYKKGGELWNEILKIGAKWVSMPYNCDGWRLDVAADLGESPEINHEFWKEFNSAVKSANPNAIVFAEHYGNGRKWIENGEWDSVMNYAGFMDPVSGFLTGVDKHCDNLLTEAFHNAELFKKDLEEGLKFLPDESSHLALNQLDNHDHARFITRTKGTLGRLSGEGASVAKEKTDFAALMQAVIFQMTWIGAPGLYYGNETAIPGWTDPDSRRPFPWGGENFEIFDFYKRAIALHKSSRVFRDGAVKIIKAENGLFAFARYNKEEAFITIINTDKAENDIVIPLAAEGFVFKEAFQVFETGEKYNIGQKKIIISNGELPLAVAAGSSLVIKIK